MRDIEIVSSKHSATSFDSFCFNAQSSHDSSLILMRVVSHPHEEGFARSKSMRFYITTLSRSLRPPETIVKSASKSRIIQVNRPLVLTFGIFNHKVSYKSVFG